MTTEEFSNEFDALLNSYSNIGSFGKTSNTIELDEYEKSVFLTKAQEEVVIDLYNGKNPFRDSFEKTEEVRSYLRELIRTYRTTERQNGYTGLTENSVFFKLPEDLWFITYESVNLGGSLECSDGEDIMVFPVTQDEFHRIRRNPFRGAGKRRVLRIDAGGNIIEIVSKYDVYSYMVRYLAKPKPIIVNDLPSDLLINNIGTRTECELNPVIHRTILERAVKLAQMSKSINTGRE